MNESLKRKLLPLLALGFVVSAAAIAALLLFAWSRLSAPSSAERVAYRPEVARGELPRLWAAPSFSFAASTGSRVTSEELRGRVWIANFLFTSCTTVCPLLTAHSVVLQRELSDPSLRFVSFSVDPEVDTPQVLADYQKRWHPNEARWLLLRPEPGLLADFALGMRVAVEPTGNPADKIMHSTLFLLVDREGQVRGAYDSNDERALERLRRDAALLLGTAPPVVAATAPDPSGSAEERGALLYRELGCAACHANPSLAPDLSRGLAERRQLESGQTVLADRAYVERSILEPGSELVSGYLGLMPSYRAHLGEGQLDLLVAYLSSLGRYNALVATSAQPAAGAPTLALSTPPPSVPPPSGTRAGSVTEAPESGPSPTRPAPPGERRNSTATIEVGAIATQPSPQTDVPARIESDPVCLMRVRVVETTPAFEHHDRTYHFCSASCQRRFSAAPESFLQAPAAPGAHP